MPTCLQKISFMCETKIKRYEQVELQIPTGAPTKVMFPDLPNLRNQTDQKIIVKFLEVITATVMPTTPNGATNAPIAELKKAVVVLYNSGEESIYRVPLLKFNRINDFANPFQPVWENLDDLQDVDWAKSYLLFSSAPANTPYSVLLGVSYLRFQR
jgi:hypothetical protein